MNATEIAAYIATLSDMVNGTTPFDSATVGVPMFGVHPSKRANVQSAVLNVLFATGGDMAIVGQINNVWSDLSAYATTATRRKVTVDPRIAIAEKVVAMDYIIRSFGSDLPFDMVDGNNVAAIVATVTAAMEKGTGTRRTYRDTLADVIASGALPVGTDVIGDYGDYKATVVPTGLSVNGDVFTNPTAAAEKAGITSAVNGWAFWNVMVDGEKVAIGTLRNA